MSTSEEIRNTILLLTKPQTPKHLSSSSSPSPSSSSSFVQQSPKRQLSFLESQRKSFCFKPSQQQRPMEFKICHKILWSKSGLPSQCQYNACNSFLYCMEHLSKKPKKRSSVCQLSSRAKNYVPYKILRVVKNDDHESKCVIPNSIVATKIIVDSVDDALMMSFQTSDTRVWSNIVYDDRKKSVLGTAIVPHGTKVIMQHHIVPLTPNEIRACREVGILQIPKVKLDSNPALRKLTINSSIKVVAKEILNKPNMLMLFFQDYFDTAQEFRNILYDDVKKLVIGFVAGYDEKTFCMFDETITPLNEKEIRSCRFLGFEVAEPFNWDAVLAE